MKPIFPTVFITTLFLLLYINFWTSRAMLTVLRSVFGHEFSDKELLQEIWIIPVFLGLLIFPVFAWIVWVVTTTPRPRDSSPYNTSSPHDLSARPLKSVPTANDTPSIRPQPHTPDRPSSRPRPSAPPTPSLKPFHSPRVPEASLFSRSLKDDLVREKKLRVFDNGSWRWVTVTKEVIADVREGLYTLASGYKAFDYMSLLNDIEKGQGRSRQNALMAPETLLIGPPEDDSPAAASPPARKMKKSVRFDDTVKENLSPPFLHSNSPPSTVAYPSFNNRPQLEPSSPSPPTSTLPSDQTQVVKAQDWQNTVLSGPQATSFLPSQNPAPQKEAPLQPTYQDFLKVLLHLNSFAGPLYLASQQFVSMLLASQTSSLASYVQPLAQLTAAFKEAFSALHHFKTESLTASERARLGWGRFMMYLAAELQHHGDFLRHHRNPAVWDLMVLLDSFATYTGASLPPLAFAPQRQENALPSTDQAPSPPQASTFAPQANPQGLQVPSSTSFNFPTQASAPQVSFPSDRTPSRPPRQQTKSKRALPAPHNPLPTTAESDSDTPLEGEYIERTNVKKNLNHTSRNARADAPFDPRSLFISEEERAQRERDEALASLDQISDAEDDSDLESDSEDEVDGSLPQVPKLPEKDRLGTLSAEERQGLLDTVNSFVGEISARLELLKGDFEANKAFTQPIVIAELCQIFLNAHEKLELFLASGQDTYVIAPGFKQVLEETKDFLSLRWRKVQPMVPGGRKGQEFMDVLRRLGVFLGKQGV